MPEIEIKNVSMTYTDADGNDLDVLKNINLDIRKGEFISLLGPSGCSKPLTLPKNTSN